MFTLLGLLNSFPFLHVLLLFICAVSGKFLNFIFSVLIEFHWTLFLPLWLWRVFFHADLMIIMFLPGFCPSVASCCPRDTARPLQSSTQRFTLACVAVTTTFVKSCISTVTISQLSVAHDSSWNCLLPLPCHIVPTHFFRNVYLANSRHFYWSVHYPSTHFLTGSLRT